MKKDVTHENFERFLQENADELQMRPAAKVWNRIEARLSRRRRWVYFTSGFFLLTASLFGYFIIDQSKAPSDPFASVRNTEPKATMSTSTATGTNNITALGTVSSTTRQSKNLVSLSSDKKTAALFQKSIPVSGSNSLAVTNATDNETTAFEPTPVDEIQPFTTTTTPVSSTQPSTVRSEFPLSIESVVNTYHPKTKRYKSEFQLFFTPTISYRRLTENKSYLQAVPRNMATYRMAALYDVNNMVMHKPDLGLELGFAFKLPLSSQLKVRSGMQFNITRYSIKAFTYRPEPATIALNNGARGVDSISTISSYRNGGGASPDWLQNFYFQVSAPVGIEFTSHASKSTRFGIAASIQPTYILGDRAYLISTDYKNYSEVPWLIRRWNANTSLETFVSYSTGKLRWQVGPQVRYQLLSSFVEQYPVKENLFDFGMKVGVSLDKK